MGWRHSVPLALSALPIDRGGAQGAVGVNNRPKPQLAAPIRGYGPLFLQNALIGEYKMPLAFCLFEVRLSEIRDQVRGPKARMRSILSSELASSGPRWRWTALRAD